MGSRAKVYANPHLGFAWLRTAGVLLIVVDHCWALLTPQSSIFPNSWHTAPGYVGLMALFAMSGYQVQHSWTRDPMWWRFAAKRLLRIVPPLAFVAAVTSMIIGPLVSTWPVGEYFSSAQTWRYLVGNSLVLLLQHRLPGVFDGNPFPYSANGSLWTLPMELVGYGVVLLIGVFLVQGAHRLLLLLPLAGLVWADTYFGATFGSEGRPGSLLDLPFGSTASYLVPFALGMVLHAYRDRIPFRPWAAAVLFAAWIPLVQTSVARYLLPVAVAYGSITMARHWPARLGKAGAWVFGSYGISLWGFLLQQLIVMAGVRQPWLLLVFSVPVAYAAGQLSWRFLEEPSLRLRRLLGPSKPAAVRAVSPVATPLPRRPEPDRDAA